ncbi:DUF4880 domain-containing protein, partial [Pseudomonas syringae pv. actinidiae]|nr:DUF4880 domain-containing protein [Pseudomonas syringae pv. actinidiae]
MSDPLFSKAEHDAITDAAAHWCMRLHADDCTVAEKKAFDQWLKAHPLHAAEYQAMAEIWDHHRADRTAQSGSLLPNV